LDKDRADRRLERERARRKRAEEALRLANQRYDELVEDSDDLIYTHDGEGTLLSANLALLRLTGHTKAEVLGQKLADFLAPEVRGEFASYLEKVTREGYAEGFLRVVTRRGEERILQYDSFWRREGSAGWVVRGIAHDVQWRWAERALRISVDRLEALLNNITDLVWMKDEQGRFTVVNEAFARFLNRSREQIIGKTDFDFLPADLAERFRVEDRSVMESGQSLQISEPFVAQGGGKTVFETIKTPISGGGQKASGTVGIARDISERRRLEEQLIQSQKMEAVGRLAGGIAHDFNNLLTTILGYSDIVLGQLEDSPLRQDIGEIKKAGEHAAALTRQLLAFSRKQIIEPKVLDLNTVVSDASKMLRRLIGENIEFVTALEPELGRVRADPGQIEQVLVNLAVNARDAMPHGGRLAIETSNIGFYEPYPSAYLQAKPGPYILLSVSDTGVGMDAETQRHIFEPFYTTKERGKGTGLGLATVYGIVKQNGGDIWVRSATGKGSSFQVYLPRVEEAEEKVETRTPASVPPQGLETILLVEDEEALRVLARRVLEGSGYTVLAVGSAEEALELSEKASRGIDLLLTDVVLTGTSGPELAKQLRQKRPGMGLLYMSGYTESFLQQDSGETEAAFLQKPFTPDSLVRRIREVLDEGHRPL
jgi:two-component system cell cycle sensor histidine kinase/response regulator CckA